MSAKTYDKQTAAFLAKIAECIPPIPSSTMQIWIENPGLLHQRLGIALGYFGEAPPVTAANRVWKAIDLGVGPRDSNSFRAALARAGCQVSCAANDLIGEVAVAAVRRRGRLNLAVTSVAELGFQSGAKYVDILQKAKQLGFQPCSLEVGLQLRLQYSDQPRGEWLVVATESSTGRDPRGFTVAHTDEGICLKSHGGFPGRRFDASEKFVFNSRA